jgi:V-type H+-transporting ATPase subunit a
VSAFQRHFVKEIRRTDELQRRLRIPLRGIAKSGYLEDQIVNSGIRIRQVNEQDISAPSAHELDELDSATARSEQRVAHLLQSKKMLERRRAELIEFRYVLREAGAFFHVCLVWKGGNGREGS